jgi:hypothetical protein
MPSASKLTAYLCILLTLLLEYTFATHNHFSSSDEAKCTLCVGAHSASPATTVKLATVNLIAGFTVALKEISAKQSLIAFALKVRPPPA